MIIVLPKANRLERDVDLVARPYRQKPSIVTAIETPHLVGRTGGRLATGHPQCADRCDGAELMPPGNSKEQATHRETLHPIFVKRPCRVRLTAEVSSTVSPTG